MRNCAECPLEKRKEILPEYHAKRKLEKSAKRATHEGAPTASSSVIFSADFVVAVVESLCADIGADANLMGADLLPRISSSNGKVVVENLIPKKIFNLAAEAPDGTSLRLTCEKVVTMDVDVHIRHGTALKIRNVRWLISEQRVPEPLLGRSILEFLGLNTAEFLAAAPNRSTGVIDAKNLAELDQSLGEGRVSRVLEGVFHVDGNDDVNPEDDKYDNNWRDLGTESDNEWEEALKIRLN